MKGRTRFLSGRAFFAIVAAIATWSLASPRAAAQTSFQGQDAVYNSSGQVTNSPAFIDASMFAFQNGTICSVIYTVLTSTNPPYPATGAVVDARALLSSTPSTSMTCAAGTTPWNNGTTFVNVPSTILLPATGGTPIKISTTWALPNNTRLIGEGDGIPSTNFTSGTTIQAANSFSGSMIQFGASAGLCLPPPSTLSVCSGMSVEKLTLDGQGQSINGITNQLAGVQSYVDHVSLYRILGTGLSISQGANNSGPYTNIAFDTGAYSGTSSTVCAQINGLTATKGIQGLRCTSETNDAPAAILLDSSNNSISDVTIVGFYDGVRVGANAAAHSNVLRNIVGNTTKPASLTPINTIHISSNNPVSDLSIMGASNSEQSGTYTIDDELTQTTLSDSYVAIYALGESTMSNAYTRYTTSPSAATWAVGTGLRAGLASEEACIAVPMALVATSIAAMAQTQLPFGSAGHQVGLRLSNCPLQCREPGGCRGKFGSRYG